MFSSHAYNGAAVTSFIIPVNSGDSAQNLSTGQEKVWKKIPGYSGYKINRSGEVIKSCGEKLESRIHGRYLVVSLKRDRGVYNTVGIHRALGLAFIPNPQNKPFVCHIDGESHNNKISNLYWGDSKDNIRDAVGHGTYRPFGRKYPGQIYTTIDDSDVQNFFDEHGY
jgi:hypothetical protein